MCTNRDVYKLSDNVLYSMLFSGLSDQTWLSKFRLTSPCSQILYVFLFLLTNHCGWVFIENWIRNNFITCNVSKIHLLVVIVSCIYRVAKKVSHYDCHHYIVLKATIMVYYLSISTRLENEYKNIISLLNILCVT